VLTLGEEISKARSRSPHTDLRTFSERCNLSHEGLRKIETDARVPGRKTLERIFQVGRVSQSERQRLTALRDHEAAKRSGDLTSIQLAKMRKDLTVKMVAMFEQFLSECDPPIHLSSVSKRELKDRVQEVMS